jgi:hypothetical protein
VRPRRRPRRVTRGALPLLVLAVLLAAGPAGCGGGESESGQSSASGSTTIVEQAPQRPPCTATIRPGADLAAALAKARGGAVLCLREGRYAGAEIPAADTDFDALVTVQPAPGAAPAFAGEMVFEGARHLRLDGLGFRAGLAFTPEAEAVELVDNDVSGVGGIYFFGDAEQGGSSSQVLIEGNRIHDIDYTGPQDGYQGYGIKSVGAQHGFVVRGNTIESVAADYIQTDVADDWTVEANTFLGPTLVGTHPQEHQDLWQVYAGGRRISFRDNVARHTGSGESLLFQLSYPGDRFEDVAVENNLFDHDSAGFSTQIYQVDGLSFRDNTVVGSRFGCVFRRDDRYPPGSRYRVERNVVAETAAGSDFGVEDGVENWGTFDSNVSSDDSATGPSSIRGWKPRWGNTVDYPPLGLPISAGFKPAG